MQPAGIPSFTFRRQGTDFPGGETSRTPEICRIGSTRPAEQAKRKGRNLNGSGPAGEEEIYGKNVCTMGLYRITGSLSTGKIKRPGRTVPGLQVCVGETNSDTVERCPMERAIRMIPHSEEEIKPRFRLFYRSRRNGPGQSTHPAPVAGPYHRAERQTP